MYSDEINIFASYVNDYKSIGSECPCGRDTLCIISKRKNKEHIFEDIIFKRHNVSLRRNCFSSFSKIQKDLLNNHSNVPK